MIGLRRTMTLGSVHLRYASARKIGAVLLAIGMLALLGYVIGHLQIPG